MLHVNPTILALSHTGNSPLAGHAERIKELLMVRSGSSAEEHSIAAAPQYTVRTLERVQCSTALW